MVTEAVDEAGDFPNPTDFGVTPRVAFRKNAAVVAQW